MVPSENEFDTPGLDCLLLNGSDCINYYACLTISLEDILPISGIKEE